MAVLCGVLAAFCAQSAERPESASDLAGNWKIERYSEDGRMHVPHRYFEVRIEGGGNGLLSIAVDGLNRHLFFYRADADGLTPACDASLCAETALGNLLDPDENLSDSERQRRRRGNADEARLGQLFKASTRWALEQDRLVLVSARARVEMSRLPPRKQR